METSETQWIQQLKAGDAGAARRLWDQYFEKLVRVARRKLGHAPRRVVDEEDVALSAFESLCRGLADGRMETVQNRDDLWYLLLAITNQKAVDHMRRETRLKRGGGEVRGESIFAALDRQSAAGLDGIAGDDAPPHFVAEMNEQFQRLLGLLRDDELRSIAVWRIEGCSVQEISGKINLTSRSVNRKLQLIRDKWMKELDEI